MRSLTVGLCLVLALALFSVGCAPIRDLMATTPDDDRKTIAKGIARKDMAPDGVQPLPVIVSAEEASDLGNEFAISVVEACLEHLKDAAAQSGWFDIYPASSADESALPEGVQYRLSLRVYAFEMQAVDKSKVNLMAPDTVKANQDTRSEGIEANLAIRLEEYRNGDWVTVASATGIHETNLWSGNLNVRDLGGLGAPVDTEVEYEKQPRKLSRTEVRNNLQVAIITGVENLVLHPRVQSIVHGPLAAHP